jgi:hypothetical protein
VCAYHSDVKMGFTDRNLPAGTHMCMIFQDETERRRIIGKFIGTGLATGEKVAYFADVMTKEEIIDWLKGMDINVTDELASNHLHVQDTLTAYCPGGKFVVEDMLGRLKAFYDESVEQRYRQARVSGEMSWALRGLPGSDRLMEYEAWVNVVLRTHPLSAICQYDANKFSGALIMDALKVHPMMIVRGQIIHNPYFLAPNVFLEEFSKRSEKAKSRKLAE